jgi:hypothetical protein
MLVGLRACEHFGFRRAPTIHCFPAQERQCVSWIRSRLPLRGSPGFAPDSLLLSEKTQKTNTDGSLLWHSIFVNKDVVGRGACPYQALSGERCCAHLNSGRWLSQVDAGNTLNLSKPIGEKDSRSYSIWVSVVMGGVHLGPRLCRVSPKAGAERLRSHDSSYRNGQGYSPPARPYKPTSAP